MTQNPEKAKSGAGKFFLGIGLGAALGALASKFIKVSAAHDEEEEIIDPADPIADEDEEPAGTPKAKKHAPKK